MFISPPKFLYKRTLISFLLLPLSFFYWFISFLNNKLSIPYKSKVKIICVGNIVLGGVGKTPFVIKLTEELLKLKLKVGIVSRGYKGRLSSSIPLIVDIKKYSVLDVGDEVYMIANHFKSNVPICICKNRKLAVQSIENDVDIIISDDGFQNGSFYKDLNIIVFDGKIGLGNGFLFPAGILRNFLFSIINKINIVVINRCCNDKLFKVFKQNGIPVFNSYIKLLDANRYSGLNVVAFAGIGEPNKFYETLKQNGVNLIKTFSFPDHYSYKDEDLNKIINEANSSVILTTEKDYVKIPNKYKNKIFEVKTSLFIDNFQDIVNFCMFE